MASRFLARFISKLSLLLVVLGAVGAAYAVPAAGSSQRAVHQEVSNLSQGRLQQEFNDGYDQLPPGRKALSMSSLVNLGFVHPPTGPILTSFVATQNTAVPDPPPVTWGPATNMSHRTTQTFGANEPAAAMHPTNDQLALSGGNSYEPSPVHSQINNTTNGGTAWSNTSAPNCASDGDGVQTWLNANVNGGMSALNASICAVATGPQFTLSHSTDGGVTWSALPSNVGFPNMFQDREYLWTDQNPSSPFYGRVYITEAVLDPGGLGTFDGVGLQSSTDGGSTWTAFFSLVDTTELNSGLNHNEYPSLAIQPSGAVVEAWHRGALSGQISTTNKVMAARSTDGGATFGPLTTIVEVPLNQSVPFNSISPGGFRWSDAPNIAADPVDGTLYAVWVQYRTANTPASAAVFLSRSDDNGATWSAPVIPFNNPDPNLFQYYPWVQVSADHMVHLTFSGGVGNNGTEAHFYVASSDKGATWSAPFQLSDITYAPTGFMGDYEAMSVNPVHGTAAILATWTEISGGAENQWSRIGTFSSIIPTSTALSSSANPSVFGQPITLTATITPCCGETGSVKFFDGATLVATAPVNSATGIAVSTPITQLTVGSHSMTAVYPGDGSFGASTSPPLTQVVNKAGTSTVLSSSHNPSTFGQSVTFTATVSPSPPSASPPMGPSGTVAFTVDGNPVTSAPLTLAGTASFATSSLTPGTHHITATYGGDSNFIGSSGSLVQTVGCTTTISGKHNGHLALGPGSWCIQGATIDGRLTIQPGAAVSITSSTLNGGISATAASAFSLCGSIVHGSVTVQGSTGFVLIGDPGDDACAGNTIAGLVRLIGNLADVEVAHNHLSSLTVSGTRGTGPFAEDSRAEIEGNTINGQLICSNNVPPATNDGQPNSVKGTNTCGL